MVARGLQPVVAVARFRLPPKGWTNASFLLAHSYELSHLRINALFRVSRKTTRMPTILLLIHRKAKQAGQRSAVGVSVIASVGYFNDPHGLIWGQTTLPGSDRFFGGIPWAALRSPTAILEQPFRLPASSRGRRFTH